jgi:hypothetical protein
MDEPDLRSLLKDEYMRIQAFTEHFDELTMKVKAWSVTFSLATLVTGFLKGNAAIVGLAALSAGAFWVTDTYVHAYQYAYYDRAGRIEGFFRNEKKQIFPLQTGSSWSERFARIGLRKLISIACWPEVALPHVLPFAVGVIVFASSLVGLKHAIGLSR